ncbi:MAG: LL-diaminopimelate aminotransferase [Bacteroidales bacterium]|jgi:LL-diaminopimelate aminotransferase|nr:LL-diaminopimelate aminotransferase [Bacteroidales bacterium]NMD01657.1 LL-diaminopimelate aminotransferase [Bacteroidales bacterium]OQB62555.1 MAG: LL-diaminopimelate aminotransferase [Bacteroidetes bacterium ADurb.Bin145]HOU01229.1 LL-diaminopimelate aminotransferase [Bacteroidales bacterium]HQK67168.1 LL-diaminopimelate aminotransferase [Bacteroidales bacterium]
MNDFFDDKISERLGGASFGKSTVIYKFELIKRAKAAARKAHPELSLIDMGVGEPDWPADEIVVKTLAEEAGKPENRWYSDNGIPEFQEAAAGYLEKVYGVKGLVPSENIIHGIGSKPVLAMLPICFINPGDLLLTTVPGYPVTATYTRYLGGEVYNLPLLESNDFLPDLDSVPPAVLKKAKLLYINYPNNPTGAVATREFFRHAVDFALKNNVIVIHDAAYGALTYDGYKPLSLMSIEGAMDVAIEVHSLSKAFNMTGWRIGFVCGNSKAVKAYATVKDNTDSGQFRAIQKAGIKAFNNTSITEKTISKYSRRFDLLVDALNETGFRTKKPKGSFYCYVKAPSGTEDGKVFNTASEFSEFLIKESLISTVPWDDAGKYVRFSVTFEAEDIGKERQVIDEMKRRIKKLKLKF